MSSAASAMPSAMSTMSIPSAAAAPLGSTTASSLSLSSSLSLVGVVASSPCSTFGQCQLEFARMLALTQHRMQPSSSSPSDMFDLTRILTEDVLRRPTKLFEFIYSLKDECLVLAATTNTTNTLVSAPSASPQAAMQVHIRSLFDNEASKRLREKVFDEINRNIMPKEVRKSEDVVELIHAESPLASVVSSSAAAAATSADMNASGSGSGTGGSSSNAAMSAIGSSNSAISNGGNGSGNSGKDDGEKKIRHLILYGDCLVCCKMNKKRHIKWLIPIDQLEIFLDEYRLGDMRRSEHDAKHLRELRDEVVSLRKRQSEENALNASATSTRLQQKLRKKLLEHENELTIQSSRLKLIVRSNPALLLHQQQQQLHQNNQRLYQQQQHSHHIHNHLRHNHHHHHHHHPHHSNTNNATTNNVVASGGGLTSNNNSPTSVSSSSSSTSAWLFNNTANFLASNLPLAALSLSMTNLTNSNSSNSSAATSSSSYHQQQQQQQQQQRGYRGTNAAAIGNESSSLGAQTTSTSSSSSSGGKKQTGVTFSDSLSHGSSTSFLAGGGSSSNTTSNGVVTQHVLLFTSDFERIAWLEEINGAIYACKTFKHEQMLSHLRLTNS